MAENEAIEPLIQSAAFRMGGKIMTGKTGKAVDDVDD
jgi:hypothetical protein